MCEVYNSVGCLTTIKKHLALHGINEFNSLNELINFQRTVTTVKQQIISNHERLVEKEKIALAAEVMELETTIKVERVRFENGFLTEIEDIRQRIVGLSHPTGLNFLKRFINSRKRRSYEKKLQHLELNLNLNVDKAVSELVGQHLDKSNRYNHINLQFKDAVMESCSGAIRELECKQRVIDEVNNSIYGALGEHKVVKELENLSDENILINDFNLRFNPALFNRQENDYIKSIQIDHLLIAPSGIFLIETKNWSESSVANLDLRSPVQQVKRTNFALFKVLTEAISGGRIRLGTHHWGDKRIPIRNLIVLTNSKPTEEFQYVKVLTVSELLGYVRYFKPIFTNEETQAIAGYLLRLNEEKQLKQGTPF